MRWFKLLPIALLGAALFLVSAGNAGAAPCAPGGSLFGDTAPCRWQRASQPFSTPELPAASILHGARYGWIEDYARFYAEPDVTSKWVRTASAGFFYGPVQGWATDDSGQEWVKIWDNWLRARHFHEVEPSAFAGVQVNLYPRRPFGWVLRDFEAREMAGGPAPDGAQLLKRYDFVEIYGAETGPDGALWYDVGEGRWVRYHAVALTRLRERPRGVAADEFWVDVDLAQQSFAAYEGDRMVFAGLHSSGLPRWPTRLGLFRVFRRDLTTPMAGGVVGDDYYYIDGVPHTMFFDRAIALHGAFWHDDFGRPKSHGCVNIAPRAAEWLYFWALDGPGDLRVWVHRSYLSEFRS